MQVMEKESDMHLFPASSKFDQRYFPDHAELGRKVQALRELDQKIVLTQGVYDLLHIGHVRYLEEAKRHGDVLVVVVDSDALTRKRKGDSRPIVPFDERLSMLASIWCVDLLTVLDIEHDKNSPIMAVKPDILITSSTTKDFTDEGKRAVEQYCSEIVTLDKQAEISTTGRIRKLAIDGADELAQKIMRTIEEHVRGQG